MITGSVTNKNVSVPLDVLLRISNELTESELAYADLQHDGYVVDTDNKDYIVKSAVEMAMDKLTDAITVYLKAQQEQSEKHREAMRKLCTDMNGNPFLESTSLTQ